jgi:hypothetical protein
MVDLHSVAASSHPSHRERESERETTSRSRAGRSRRPRGRTDTTTVVLESQSQPTAGMISSPLKAVGPDAVLLAARQLLDNPPPTGASSQQPSSGIRMSTNSSPSPSTRHTVTGGTSHLRNSHAFRLRRVRHPWRRCPSAARCTPTGAAPRADGQLPNVGPQGGNQPPSRWGEQSHHHRAQPREASRHRGLQPRERFQLACTSGCAPSRTCTSPP